MGFICGGNKNLIMRKSMTPGLLKTRRKVATIILFTIASANHFKPTIFWLQVQYSINTAGKRVGTFHNFHS
jgi:hypothetical protein